MWNRKRCQRVHCWSVSLFTLLARPAVDGVVGEACLSRLSAPSANSRVVDRQFELINELEIAAIQASSNSVATRDCIHDKSRHIALARRDQEQREHSGPGLRHIGGPAVAAPAPAHFVERLFSHSIRELKMENNVSLGPRAPVPDPSRQTRLPLRECVVDAAFAVPCTQVAMVANGVRCVSVSSPAGCQAACSSPLRS